MSPNTPEAWPPPPTLPPPGQEQNVWWKLPVTLSADRNWLVSFDDSEIVFRRPRKQRLLGISFSGLALVCGVLSLHNLPYRLAHDAFGQVMDWLLFLIMFIVGLPPAAPNSLALDLQSRTYRFRYVPLLVPKVVTGPLTDIDCIALVRTYTIELRWSEAVAKGRLCPTLGQYSDKPADAAAARTLMRRVAAKLDVPCAYPYLFHIKYPEAQDE